MTDASPAKNRCRVHHNLGRLSCSHSPDRAGPLGGKVRKRLRYGMLLRLVLLLRES
jgi:hypothetical protein